MSVPIVSKLACKIRHEMKELSSDSYDSILRDSVEAVKNFNWETVRLELIQNMPTLTGADLGALAPPFLRGVYKKL